MDAAAQRKLYLGLADRQSGNAARLELADADLRGAQLVGADLVGAQLPRARLDFAALPGARLSTSDLREASLTGADLGGADLAGADLRDADLSEARLDSAVLTDADLRGASIALAKGQPLSWSGARIDAKFIDRSGLSERDVGHLVRLGVLIDREDFASLPPSAHPTSHRPSLAVESLRVTERATRRALAEQDRDFPVSRRWFDEIQTILNEARIEASPQLKSAPLPVITSSDALAELPKLGDTMLGVLIERELEPGTNSRCFVGRNESGDQVVLRVFDFKNFAAPLQLAAFQHGVETMARWAYDEQCTGFAEITCVSVDLTAYVTRYYPNGNLLSLLEVDLSTKEKVRLFRAICEAVAAAHEAGILVRSLKPTNILLDGLTPVLTEIDLVDLSMTGGYGGQANGYGVFAAPEELLGRGSRSPTADVYSLGRLLHTLLRGSIPDVATEPRPTLSDLEGKPKGLVEVVRCATAADPADRYQYVEALLRDLGDYNRAAAGVANSLRPGALSRLSLRPFSDAAARRRARSEPKQPLTAQKQAQQKPLEQSPSLVMRVTQDFLERRVELTLGSLALLLALGACGLIIGKDLSASGVQTLATVTALATGVATWLAPRPKGRVTALRLSSFAAVALLVALIDPARLVVLHWQQNLRSKDANVRSRAVPLLVQQGYRNFGGTNLTGATLAQTDLTQVSFRGTTLRDASLMGAALLEADFSEADLTGAVLLGADLRGAHLEKARGLSEAQCDEWTALPKPYECLGGRLHERAVD